MGNREEYVAGLFTPFSSGQARTKGPVLAVAGPRWLSQYLKYTPRAHQRMSQVTKSPGQAHSAFSKTCPVPGAVPSIRMRLPVTVSISWIWLRTRKRQGVPTGGRDNTWLGPSLSVHPEPIST